MLTTVFKDKIPKGISYPLPLEFLMATLPIATEQVVALYFVHGSHWNYKVAHERLHRPHTVLQAGRERPMFRNNNRKVALDAEDCNLHFVLWAMPSESRHVLQKQFKDTAAEPLARWPAGSRTISHGRTVPRFGGIPRLRRSLWISDDYSENLAQQTGCSEPRDIVSVSCRASVATCFLARSVKGIPVLVMAISIFELPAVY